MSHYRMVNYHWYEKEAELTQVVRWAGELDRQYPTSRLVAVGQSAAWMVHVAALMRRQQGRPENCAIIPFSGNFMNREYDPGKRYPDNMWTSEFTPDDAKGWPKAAPLKNYFNHLATHGCTAAQIIAGYKAGVPTVFVDMAETAKGIASFMTIYLQEARRDDLQDDLLRSASFYIYDHFGNLDRGHVKLHDPDGESYTVPITARALDTQGRFVIKLVADGNSLGPQTSRLAPYYDLLSRHPAPQDAENQGVQDIVRANLHRTLQNTPPPAP